MPVLLLSLTLVSYNTHLDRASSPCADGGVGLEWKLPLSWGDGIETRLYNHTDSSLQEGR